MRSFLGLILTDKKYHEYPCNSFWFMFRFVNWCTTTIQIQIQIISSILAQVLEQTPETWCQVLFKAPVVKCLHWFLTEPRVGAQVSGAFLPCPLFLLLLLRWLSAAFAPTPSIAVGTWLILLLKTLKDAAGVRKRAIIHVGVYHVVKPTAHAHILYRNILVQFLLVGDGGSAIPHIIACFMQTNASSQHGWRMIKRQRGKLVVAHTGVKMRKMLLMATGNATAWAHRISNFKSLKTLLETDLLISWCKEIISDQALSFLVKCERNWQKPDNVMSTLHLNNMALRLTCWEPFSALMRASKQKKQKKNNSFDLLTCHHDVINAEHHNLPNPNFIMQKWIFLKWIVIRILNNLSEVKRKT